MSENVCNGGVSHSCLRCFYLKILLVRYFIYMYFLLFSFIPVESAFKMAFILSLVQFNQLMCHYAD